jgi:formylglycine-generating enzyme required for sulfatase activity
LTPACGSAGASSCCGSPLVPGGTYYRSWDSAADNRYPDMTNPATVSTFRLDTYEVTVGRFRQFVEAGQGTQQAPPAIGAGSRMLNGMADQAGWEAAWNSLLAPNTAALIAAVKCNATTQSWTDSPAGNEELPMTCITWYEAFAFCAWDGGFLPTEAEWNYAAAGGSDQRAYPWSNPPADLTIDCSYANYFNGAFCVNPPNGGANRVGSESPTGDGKWGHADLAGNVFEWTLDWYATPYGNPCSDCADLTLASGRLDRGGSFGRTGSSLRAADRAHTSPNVRNADVGVRCATVP